MTRTVTF